MFNINKKSINLKGVWNYKLDPEDKGIREEWFAKNLNMHTLNLPGTLCENGIGEKLDIEYDLTPKTVRSLRPKYDYIGACWYQKKLTIPQNWDNKKIFLSLERIIIKSEVWVNEKYIGNMSSLVVAHEYDITSEIIAGEENIITILIDNRDTFYLSTYGHSYTNESQTIWNGIVGDICLYAKEKVFLEDILVITAENNKSVKVKSSIKNFVQEGNCDKEILFTIKDLENEKIIGEQTLKIDLLDELTDIECTVDINESVTPWDEFNTKLYELSAKIIENNSSVFEKTLNFGFRNVKAIDRDILLNNKKIYLRGNLECCVHPLTGYPPCDEEYWITLLKKVKEYGMNHLRFHSNCPPEAAFSAADKVGVYFQVEGPVWLDTWFMELGSHKEHYEFMPLEAERIMKKYSNHPSFCIFCNGNEFRGDFQLLHDIVEKCKKIRPDIIYTLSSNYDRPLDSEDDIFISVESDKKGMRGNRFFGKMATTLKTDYSEAVATRNIPMVAHEGGQFSVYPNVKEIPKYKGNLVPVNYMAIEQDLKNRDMLHMVDKFVRASGDFSARLYKEEIESYMRTIDYGGFQILGIQDFPGQCTATVGILDSFWDSKNIVSPKWFRQFCNDVVLLIKAEKRIYCNNEKFFAELMVNQFGACDIENANILYKFITQDEKIIAKGEFNNLTLKSNSQIIIGNIEDIDLSLCTEPSEIKVFVEIKDTEYKNSWSIWVYPEIDKEIINRKINDSDITVVSKWNEEVEKRLQNGEKVLLIPDRESFINKQTYDSSFYPVFWSPVFFNKKNPCGLYINKSNIFEHFPTGSYSNYQWYNLLENSFNFDLDNLPQSFTPIIDAVPNYYYNHRLTNFIEAKVGNGILVICSIQLEKLQDYLEAKWLKYSIVNYLNNVNSETLMELTVEQAKGILISDVKIIEEKAIFIKEDFIN